MNSFHIKQNIYMYLYKKSVIQIYFREIIKKFHDTHQFIARVKLVKLRKKTLIA